MKKLIQSLVAVALISLGVPALADYTHVGSEQNGTPASPIVLPAIVTAAGDVMLISVQSNSSGLSLTCTTSQSDTVMVGPQSIGEVSTNAWLYSFYIASAVGGSTVVTISGGSLYNATVDVYRGLGSYIGSSDIINDNGLTGANDQVSGNINITSAPAFIWSVATAGSFQGVATAGTSPLAFTGRSTINDLTTEDAAVSGTGNAQATWGMAVSGAVPVIAFAFAQAGGGSAAPTNGGFAISPSN